MRRLTLPLLVGLAIVAAGCGSDSDSGSTSTAAAAPAKTAAATTSTSSDTGCQTVAAAKPKPGKADKPTKTLTASDQVTVTLDTNCGSIPILLDTKRAPKTASSFASLAKQGFYDGLSFHRIVPGFVIQGGDPQGTGVGGPGYQVVEAPPANLKYTPGVVAMAKTEVEKPGTSGSQFFIVSGPQAEQLTPDYALVGKVTGDGMKTVAKIDATPADAQGVPSTPIVISKATVSGE
jgi:peptidyl-prolyl cis-trans isomerase B (cyclophilin B)